VNLVRMIGLKEGKEKNIKAKERKKDRRKEDI
jgi:hypothetical protein